MASSQVEIASSAPFGCVLRDRNQNNHKVRTNAFRKNFNDLVQTQLGSTRNEGSNENSHPSIDLADLWVHHPQPSPATTTTSSSSNETNHHAWEMGHARISENSNSNDNSHQHNIDYTDLWVHNPPRNQDENNSHNKSTSGGKCDRKCEIGSSSGPLACPPRGRTHDGVQSQPVSRVRSPEPALRPLSSSGGRSSRETGHASTSQKEKSQKGKSSSSSSPVLAPQTADSCSIEVPNLGAVSSLVQKWRSFEGKKSSSDGSSCSGGSALAANVSFVEAPPAGGGSDACEESVDIRPDTPTISEESNGDWESVRTGFSASPGRDFDTAENERIRVADIIRKLSSNGEEQHDRDQAIFHESSLPCIRTFMDQSEQRPFAPFYCSPLIRGRQAFSDFQMQMERERHKELYALSETKAVSKFSHRGRIQAVLKVRFLHRGAEEKDHQRLTCSVSDSNRPKQSAILHLREIFSLGAKQCASQLRSPQVKVVDCNTEIEKSSVSCRQGNGNPQNKNTEPVKSASVVKSDTSAHSTRRDIKNHGSNDMVEKSKVEVQRSERKENHSPKLLPQREKDHVTTTSKGSSDRKSSLRLMPVKGNVKYRESDSTVQNSAPSLQNSGKVYQEASPNSYVHRKPEFPTTGTSSQCSEGNVYTKFYEASNQQLAGNGTELMNDISQAPGDWEQEKDNNHHLNCSWVNDWINDGLEELQSYYSQEEVEVNHDWINDVSRPRHTWEDLRQARYQEMLDPFVENDDIRNLLQRKSVSSFLSSGMRESIDRLMMSRTQEISRKDHLEGKRENQYNREDQVRVNEENEEHDEYEEEEEYKQNNEEEEEEAEDDDDSIVYNDDYEEDQEHNIQTEQYSAAQSYMNQTTSLVHSRHHDVSDNDSDQAAAAPYIQHSPLPNVRILESQRSNASCLQSQRSMNHNSVEMELVYELKGNMEQLHQEVSEIRRSLKTCVNMQMELQQSIRQEIMAALCQPVKQKRRERKDSSRGRCCICCEEPIDSLLYRCGHMCTCFACAHELQWGKGKCPVCRAPILDIVRTYAHS